MWLYYNNIIFGSDCRAGKRRTQNGIHRNKRAGLSIQRKGNKSMRKIKENMNRLVMKGYIKRMRAKARIAGVLAQKSGEGFVDTALKILISVVIGALLLAGLYTLFKDTVLPTLTEKVRTLFNYQG